MADRRRVTAPDPCAEAQAVAEAGFRRVTHGPASRVYRHFDRGSHVIPCEKITNERIHVGADFNYEKMSFVAARVRGEECHIFDEIIGWNTTTEEQGERLSQRLQERRAMMQHWSDYLDELRANVDAACGK